MEDPFNGITDEQIMEMSKSCGISLGSSAADLAASLKKLDQERAARCSVAEAT